MSAHPINSNDPPSDMAVSLNIVSVMPENNCFYDVEVIADVVRALLGAHRDEYGITRIIIEKDGIWLHLIARENFKLTGREFTRAMQERAEHKFRTVALEESLRSNRARNPKTTDPGTEQLTEEQRELLKGPAERGIQIDAMIQHEVETGERTCR